LKLEKEQYNYKIIKTPELHPFSREMEMMLVNKMPVFQFLKHVGMPVWSENVTASSGGIRMTERAVWKTWPEEDILTAAMMIMIRSNLPLLRVLEGHEQKHE
jgi:hypothetical protein